jgi:hypothetical protein
MNAIALGALLAVAALAPFSTAPAGGPLPPGWRIVPVPHATPAEISLEADGATTVVRIAARAGGSSVAHSLAADVEDARLRWRWKVDRSVATANLETRAGDDYAARVYVTFDVPLERLSFAGRARMRIARFLYGADVPVAALCYVWDNRHPPGTQAWNAYSDHVRMVVLESGDRRAGQWVEESRDVAADYQAAFGTRWPGPLPRVSGVAVSADTDQTGESVTAWFGDLRLERTP